MRISERAERIEPFWVMEVAKAASQKAREVAHTDRPVVFLNIGEPDFTAPPRVQAAAQAVVASGQTQYTPALGLDALRQAISGLVRAALWRAGARQPHCGHSWRLSSIAIGLFGTDRQGR
jgi:hypothetical protein